MKWYWMSFVDGTRPKGSQFLGCILIQGHDFKHALSRTWLLEINPGGEIAFFEVPWDLEYRIDPALTNRLLSREEALSIDEKWITN